jgi:hypothetical protein
MREAYGGAEDMSTSTQEKVYPQELKGILQRANAGDLTVLPELNRVFDEYPELTTRFGDLVRHAEQAMLTIVAGNCLTGRVAISREMGGLRDRLAASATSELEKLLVDRICICWLGVYHADVDLAQQLLANPAGASPAAQAAQKRLDGAHRRFLTAVKALATVQKLVRPAPSPLELLNRTVPETGAGRIRDRSPRRVAGAVPVLN